MSQKREQILRTAMQLFTEEGFHATPTSKIAKEAEVATGTLFHHFESKEALINELYIYVKKRLQKALLVDFDPNDNFKTILFKLWKNDLHWFKVHYDEFIFLQQYHHSNLIMDSTRELLYKDFTEIIEKLQSAIAQQAFKTDDLEFITCGFVANLQHNNVHFHKYPETFTDANIERHFEIYYSGISHNKEN